MQVLDYQALRRALPRKSLWLNALRKLKKLLDIRRRSDILSAMKNESYRTAITRKKLSSPVQWLLDNGWLPLNKRSLDFGCGRGFDANALGFEKYDPHYFPNSMLVSGLWQTIVCNYVLNTIETQEKRLQLCERLRRMLDNDGIAFIVVRRDVKVEGWTNRHTFQCNPVLPLNIIAQPNKRFCIYRLDKGDRLV